MSEPGELRRAVNWYTASVWEHHIGGVTREELNAADRRMSATIAEVDRLAAEHAALVAAARNLLVVVDTGDVEIYGATFRALRGPLRSLRDALPKDG